MGLQLCIDIPLALLGLIPGIIRAVHVIVTLAFRPVPYWRFVSANDSLAQFLLQQDLPAPLLTSECLHQDRRMGNHDDL